MRGECLFSRYTLKGDTTMTNQTTQTDNQPSKDDLRYEFYNSPQEQKLWEDTAKEWGDDWDEQMMYRFSRSRYFACERWIAENHPNLSNN